MVSIMPGMETGAPERTETSSGVAGVAKPLAHFGLQRLQAPPRPALHAPRAERPGRLSIRVQTSVVIVKPGGTGRPMYGHLGKVGTLAA